MTAVPTRTDRPEARLAPARSAASGGTRRLLLATDLSEASQAATDEAFELAKRLEASLLVVSVIDPGSLLLPGGRFRARVDQVRERREVQAQALVERGRTEGVEVSFLVWTGDPGDMIVEAAEAEHVVRPNEPLTHQRSQQTNGEARSRKPASSLRPVAGRRPSGSQREAEAVDRLNRAEHAR